MKQKKFEETEKLSDRFKENPGRHMIRKGCLALTPPSYRKSILLKTPLQIPSSNDEHWLSKVWFSSMKYL